MFDIGPIDWLTHFCNILVFVIPYTIYKINNRLHKYGDPVWKKTEQEKDQIHNGDL